MRLEGLHHVTAITAEAQQNVDFYVETMGLRMVKKTVNYDQPDVYHLYYGDELGSPGSILTFFEFPGARQGRHGAGMVHTVSWRVAGDAALDFWAARLEHAGRPVERRTGALQSSDPEGMGIELLTVEGTDPPLTAAAHDIPAEHALQGFHGVRAYARDPRDSEHLLNALTFEPTPGGFSHRASGAVAQGATSLGELARGAPSPASPEPHRRHAYYVYDNPPDDAGFQGAGSVHHVAWAAHDEEHLTWGGAAQMAGARPTDVRDRTYFKSIYFREPSGVLFEIATLSPGFAVDEPLETLGEALILPARYEQRRERIERILTPVTNPRSRTAA
jgi:glyoxalase family protein